jgi:hypothetical protein
MPDKPVAVKGPHTVPDKCICGHLKSAHTFWSNKESDYDDDEGDYCRTCNADWESWYDSLDGNVGDAKFEGCEGFVPTVEP